MGIGRKLDAKKTGDALWAERDWNALIREVESLRNMRGRRGISVYRDAAGTIISAPHAWKIHLFQLTEAMILPPTLGEGATVDDDTPDCPRAENAQAVTLGPTSRGYLAQSDWKATLYLPTTFRDSYVIGQGLMSFGNGSRVYAGLNPYTNRWEILTPPLDTWRFKLTDALTKGASATAKLLYYDTVGLDYETSTALLPEVEFTVWDISQRHSQYAVPSGVDAAYGYAKWFPDSQRWEIIEKQPCARLIHGTLTAAMAEIDGTGDIDNVTPCGDVGFTPVANSAATITVSNRYDWEGDDNGEAWAAWDGTTWHFEQVLCPV